MTGQEYAWLAGCLGAGLAVGTVAKWLDLVVETFRRP